MNSVYRKEIMPDVHLTCVTTGKFKTGCLSVSLVDRLSRETAARNALLPSVLLRGTASHPDMNSLSQAMDELYGAVIEPVVRKKGEKQCFGFLASFADDDFLPRGEHVLEKTARLLGELLLEPCTKNGWLRSEYVESERENLAGRIRALVNDKHRYALLRLTQLMCRGERCGVSRLGSEAAARKITAGTLTRHYRRVIAERPVELFYCGAAEPRRVENALLDAFAALPRNQGKPEPEEAKKAAVHPNVRYFRESMDVTQGNLAVGFRLEKPPEEETLPAAMVMNALYGGSATSRLFRNVREKLSLCYYASSMLEKHKGLLLVSSGISFEKYDQALQEILRQLDCMKNGEMTEEELQNGIRYLTTHLQLLEDEPFGLENFYLDQAVAGMSFQPAVLAGRIRQVTREQVQAAAAAVRQDSVYFLTGREADDEV